MPFHALGASRRSSRIRLAAFSMALTGVLIVPGSGLAQESVTASADSAAIVRTALDYIEGFYSGDAARMERALHPELAKRIIYPPREPGGAPRFEHIGAGVLIERTRGMASRPVPAAEQVKDVTILDVYRNAASVKIVAASWVDYLHVVRDAGAWKIVNVLWELRPRPESGSRR